MKLNRRMPIAVVSGAPAALHQIARRGFQFVGSTICYAFMQAAGMVNDHMVECFRHRPVSRLRQEQ